jgi:chitodextrinase
MKKILAFVLTAMTAVGFMGWGAISAHAVTMYTAQQVAQHNTASDCWLIISGQVYDVTNFIPIHPGGNAIVPYCGTDATAVFNSIHNQSAFALLPTYLIGDLGTALIAPSGLAGAPTQTTVVLNWTAATGGVAPITYTVMRNGTSVGTTTSATFTDTGLVTSTTYIYTVQAVDSTTPTPNTISSTQISVTTLAGSTASIPLTAPSGLAGAPTQTTVVLNWTGSTGGVSPITYTIMRNGTSAGNTTSTTFTDTGLTASTTYAYTVTATDSATPTANTTSSTQISVTTLGNKIAGGGGEHEDENEIENEHENEGGRSSTSTPPTGGHGDDHGGTWTSTGGQHDGGSGTPSSGGHTSGGRRSSDD